MFDSKKELFKFCVLIWLISLVSAIVVSYKEPTPPYFCVWFPLIVGFIGVPVIGKLIMLLDWFIEL